MTRREDSRLSRRALTRSLSARFAFTGAVRFWFALRFFFSRSLPIRGSLTA